MKNIGENAWTSEAILADMKWGSHCLLQMRTAAKAISHKTIASHDHALVLILRPTLHDRQLSAGATGLYQGTPARSAG
jgi:hypothetical protein